MSPLDLVVIVIYVLGCTALGAWLGSRAQGLKGYFLGESNIPAWAVMVSIVATETSTATFLSVPGVAYRLDFTYLQLALGYILGRIVVTTVLLPSYFRGEIYTAYQVLEQRFGGATRTTASLLFLATRTLADGLRLFLAAKVLELVTGWPIGFAIVAVGLTTIIYTYLGGMKAVIWTDVIQFSIYITGAIVALAILTRKLPGGMEMLLSRAEAAHKFHMFDFTPTLTRPFNFWAGLIGGMVLNTATHGADQMMVQRYLSARSRAQASLALIASGFVIFAQFALFLFIGVSLFVFYQEFPPTSVGPKGLTPDEVFAYFIVHYLPTGILGLVIAAIFSAAMGTLSGSLNASASTTVNDLYRPLAPETDERHLLRLSKVVTAAWGVLQMAVAYGATRLQDSVVNNALRIASFTTGLLLGLFLLGILTRRVGQSAAFVGLLAGLTAVSTAAFATPLAWPWYALVGTTTVFIVGNVAALVLPTPSPKLAPAGKMSRTLPFLVLTLLVATPLSARAALPEAPPADLGLDPDRLARIDTAVDEAIADRKVPGAVVLVGRRGKVARARASGRRAVVPADEPMTRDTVFDLASLTKPVATATSVMILVEQGKIRLEDTLGRLWPEADNHGKGAITVEQLLRHRSGLIADNPIADYDDGPDAAWRRIAELGLVNPPGERFHYSDVNYLILGKLVERVGGERLDRFAGEQIFRPLGMTDTGFRPIGPLGPSAVPAGRIAPTEEEFGFSRGVVHDPRARALGGVAGHAGLFGTADDLAIFAQMLLDGGLGPDGRRVLSPMSVRAMISPGDTPEGQRRGLGWDIATGYSAPRGTLFGPRSFGHTGFTGTSLWIDPDTSMFVILLTSRLHPDGKAPSPTALRARVATLASAAIVDPQALPAAPEPPIRPVDCGIDVLVLDGFEPLRGKRVGLVTNQTGRTRDGLSTIDVLFRAPGVELVTLFSPEHGIRGLVDAEVADSKDEATGLPIVSLYGKTRKPTPESLEGLDVLVYDIQDIGTRYYTYISTLGLVLEAAAGRKLPVIILDRPNPIGGLAVSGPVRDPEFESFIAHHALPVRHGMTVGELARLFNAERKVGADVRVIACAGWRRGDLYDRTGLTWINPSPNMRSLTEALLYPGVGLLEATNLATGRGTDMPFERVGAPWIDPRGFAQALNGRGLPGVRFVPIRFTPRERQYAGRDCGGVQILITHWDAFDPLGLGVGLAVVLRELYPKDWEPSGFLKMVADRATYDVLLEGRGVPEIMALWRQELDEFRAIRSRYLIYE